jgi:hypothetical protein
LTLRISFDIVAQYREGRREVDAQKIHDMRSNAYMYAELITDIKTLKTLRGLDSGEKLEPRDKIRATAARVGLAVPYFADERKFDSTDSSASESNKSNATSAST